MSTKQKFERGDVVRIAKDLGRTMSHFPSDKIAVVMGSYKDQYGGNNTRDYTLNVKGIGECSWYEEHQLTLVESGNFPKFNDYCKSMFKKHSS